MKDGSQVTGKGWAWKWRGYRPVSSVGLQLIILLARWCPKPAQPKCRLGSAKKETRQR